MDNSALRLRRPGFPSLVLFLGASLLMSSPALAQDAARGARLFHELECAGCHGDRAQGMMGPTLAGTRLDVEDVRSQVRAPSSERMPTFPPAKLSDEDVANIHAWLQQLEPPTLAQEPTWWSIDLLNLPTSALPRGGSLEIHFTHRFAESIVDAGRERLFGLDSFAFPSFWFSWGAHDRVAPYVGRSANLATWEFGAKILVLDEGSVADLPVSVAANVGGTFLDADGIEEDTRFTAELPVSARLHDRLSVLAVPIFTTAPDELGTAGAEDHAWALGLGGSVRLSRRFSLDGEWVGHLSGFERQRGVPQWQTGLGIHVGRHLFQILVTNGVFTTPDFMAGGTVPTGIDSNVKLGFNLVRAFDL